MGKEPLWAQRTYPGQSHDFRGSDHLVETQTRQTRAALTTWKSWAAPGTCFWSFSVCFSKLLPWRHIQPLFTGPEPHSDLSPLAAHSGVHANCLQEVQGTHAAWGSPSLFVPLLGLGPCWVPGKSSALAFLPSVLPLHVATSPLSLWTPDTLILFPQTSD